MLILCVPYAIFNPKIISFCYGIQNYTLKPSVVWLSLIAVIISIIYASSIKIAFSVICIVIVLTAYWILSLEFHSPYRRVSSSIWV